MRRLRNRLAGALLSVLALTLTATGCAGSAEAESDAGTGSGPPAAPDPVADRVELLARDTRAEASCDRPLG